ncbi:MAG TPA: histidinol-phosphate transaminase [Candidatus Acidoferrum sp.]|nr:histidinol-phosphate transaminase [Candidatus Acidoferrum sp.]
MPRSSAFIRPLVKALHPYVPGEQPKIRGLIKLNTNENPYPPSPKVLQATRAAVDKRLRLYPNPSASALRESLAKLHGCAPENIIVGNGSDELLALAVRTFVAPADSPIASRMPRASQTMVQYFTPSYSLYSVLAETHGARTNAVRLEPNFVLPSVRKLKSSGSWDFYAALSFVTTPNAPSGRGYTTRELDALCRAQNGVIVLDEAYVDFAREDATSLALKHRHAIVARTFSKAYSLCFQRVGYFIAHRELVAALDKMRDSYNVNGLGQIAAQATLKDLPYYRRNFRRVIATRERLSRALRELGFEVFPSSTNFILVRPPRFPAEQWLEKLRANKVLVRWFKHPETRDFLRITIGTDSEIDTLLKVTRRLLK